MGRVSAPFGVTGWIKVGVLAFFVVAAPLSGRGEVANLRPFVDGVLSAAPPLAFALALSPVLFSYLGWNATVFVASEIHDPGRNVPRSLFIGLGLCIALYLALNLAYLYAAPVTQLAGAANAGELAASVILGPHGGGFVAAFVLISILGTLNATILNQMKSLSGAEFLYVATDGSRLTTFASGHVDVPSGQSFDEGTEHRIGPLVRMNGEEFRGQRLTFRGTSPNAGGVVYIFYPESLLNEAIADAVRPSFLGLLFGLVAVGLTFGIGQRLVGRIRDLEKRTRQIAAGDFAPMPLPRAKDELRDLIVSVNEMADRLAKLHQAVERTERLRLTAQLAGGLAHQLRNGVTGAKLAVQVYLADHTDEDTEALEVTLRQLSLMEANLRRFIDLGRPGEGKREECSLSATLTDVVELHRPRCKHAGIELLWEPPPEELRIDGDRGQLAPGLLADVNVIDYDALRLSSPRMVFDLPASGRRLVQHAEGYVATLKCGEPIFEGGEPTGALPGKLLRGARA